jgi:hypothetical protein
LISVSNFKGKLLSASLFRSKPRHNIEQNILIAISYRIVTFKINIKTSATKEEVTGIKNVPLGE